MMLFGKVKYGNGWSAMKIFFSYLVPCYSEECGLFGVWGIPDTSRLTYFGMHSLQHRSQEEAGIKNG